MEKRFHNVFADRQYLGDLGVSFLKLFLSLSVYAYNW